ncbi:MAG: L-threonylcarbamoyladenylate synthase [Deltaproteobacteria bacterium]|nr:L-threonylcarbamoyladenylate synthase [Deltaproteobacteria bacterium]
MSVRIADQVAIAAAAQALRAGELVAFPTETVYGLGAVATDAAAVARIFAVKQRPAFDPVIVHVESLDRARRVVARLDGAARRLAERFWPGPLTLVLPRAADIPDIVTAGLPTVGVRLPSHPVAQALIAATDRPIAAPSANPFGYVSPTTAAHVAAQLGDAVPLILDGGACAVGLESTIVGFADGQPTLLRSGAITLEMLEAELGAVRVATDTPLPTAPGQLPRHYAPRTPLTLIDSPAAVAAAERQHAALLATGPVADTDGFAHVERLSNDGDLLVAATRLFAAMRALDAGGFARVYALRVAETGIGRAIMDRLRRASH